MHIPAAAPRALATSAASVQSIKPSAIDVSSRDGLSWLAGAFLGVAIVLLLWRYVGINHDGLLYLGQALAQRWPGIYGQDLVFVHGAGQERYTLFPWLLNQAIGWSSPPNVFLWGALACLLCFAAASWFCVRSLLPATQRCWAWLAVLCLPSAYGVISIFSYREQFLTPRPVAESLCLVGIGLLAQRRWGWALCSLALAGLFHPLQTIAVILVAWPWAVLQDRRWLHAAWCCIPVAVLGVAGIAPFDGLFRQMDAAWLSAIHEATSQIFLTSWATADFRLLGFDVFVLVLAGFGLRGPFGRWCAAALAGMALGTAASLVLVDGLHLELPAQLQLWRAHWLGHLFAMAAIGALLFRDVRDRDGARALLLALTCVLAWSMPGWIWIPLMLLYAAWPKVFDQAQARLKPLLGWLFALGLAALFGLYVASELLPFRMAHYRLELYALDRRILAFPLIALGLPLLGVHIWSRLARRGRSLLFIFVLCPLVAIGAVRWDIRSPINRAFEQAAFQPEVFGVHLPEDAQVYWGQHMLIGPWLVLQRASYFSPHQIAGIVFNRALALDGAQRLKRMRPLIEDDLGCQDRNLPLNVRQGCRISDASMISACTPGADRPPDFLVLPYRQPHESLGAWVIQDPVETEPAMTYWLYRCTDVMRDLQSIKSGP